MPNWCHNRVNLDEGKDGDLKKLRDRCCRKVPLQGENHWVLDFNKIVPVHGEATADSQRKAWGTKWALTDEDAEDWPDDLPDIELHFETAWAPPDMIYKEMETIITDLGLDVNISWFYDEPGMQFAGYLNNE